MLMYPWSTFNWVVLYKQHAMFPRLCYKWLHNRDAHSRDVTGPRFKAAGTRVCQAKRTPPRGSGAPHPSTEEPTWRPCGRRRGSHARTRPLIAARSARKQADIEALFCICLRSSTPLKAANN